jgi:hypothetical protein
MMKMTDYTYYYSDKTGFLYRTYKYRYMKDITSKPIDTIKVERWNTEQPGWTGYIHDHEKIKKAIESKTDIYQVSESFAIKIVLSDINN